MLPFYHFSSFRWCVDNALIKGEIEEREYSILLVMSELSTVRCDRVLGLWIAGTRASSVDGEVLWPMDCVVDGGEGQPGPELGPGGSCGVHSWIEGASGDKTKEVDGG